MPADCAAEYALLFTESRSRGFRRLHGKLHVDIEAAVQAAVCVQAQPVAASDVLQRAGELVGGAQGGVQAQAEVAAELNPRYRLPLGGSRRLETGGWRLEVLGCRL